MMLYNIMINQSGYRINHAFSYNTYLPISNAHPICIITVGRVIPAPFIE